MKHAAVMTVLLAARLVSAPPPRLIREIDLSRVIPVRPGFMPATNFAFSPDEKWLAVTFSTLPVDPRKRLGNGGQSGSDSGSYALLLVPVNGLPDKQVQIDPGLRPVGTPLWPPSSDAFLVQGLVPDAGNSHAGGIAKLWNLRGEELFHRKGPSILDVRSPGGVFGFLDAEHLLVRGGPAKSTPVAFEIADRRGQIVDRWNVPEHWSVADISPDRHLVAVFSDQRASKTLVVDYPTKKIVLAKDNPYGPLALGGGRSEYFTEDGRTLCSVGSAGVGDPQYDTATECWNVDSGKKIAEFGGFPGGAPAVASSHGARLVLTHNVVLPKRSAALVYFQAKRVVWDFRSGTEIAAWDTRQTVVPNPSHIRDSVAISSTGRYVAEADGALLRIYELP